VWVWRSPVGVVNYENLGKKLVLKKTGARPFLIAVVSVVLLWGSGVASTTKQDNGVLISNIICVAEALTPAGALSWKRERGCLKMGERGSDPSLRHCC